MPGVFLYLLLLLSELLLSVLEEKRSFNANDEISDFRVLFDDDNNNNDENHEDHDKTQHQKSLANNNNKYTIK